MSKVSNDRKIALALFGGAAALVAATAIVKRRRQEEDARTRTISLFKVFMSPDVDGPLLKTLHSGRVPKGFQGGFRPKSPRPHSQKRYPCSHDAQFSIIPVRLHHAGSGSGGIRGAAARLLRQPLCAHHQQVKAAAAYPAHPAATAAATRAALTSSHSCLLCDAAALRRPTSPFACSPTPPRTGPGSSQGTR